MLRGGALTEPEFDRAVAECRAHLRQPDTISTLCAVFQARGEKRA